MFIVKQKVELDYLKKVQATIRDGVSCASFSMLCFFKHPQLLIITLKKKFLKKNTIETLFIHPSYFRKHLELAEFEQAYINKTPELKSILESIKNDRGE